MSGDDCRTKKACAQCPWRRSNQGTRHRFGFYRKANLRRLWNEVRKGGAPQSCHLTDPGHPDHIAVGASPNATAQECPGSVVLVLRELYRITGTESGLITPENVDAYLGRRKKGLSKRGILYWAVERIQFAGVPFFGGSPLPSVDVADPEIGLPAELEEG